MTSLTESARSPSSDLFLGEESVFRLIVEHGTDTFFLIEVETQQCLYVSPTVRLLLGRMPEALIGRPFAEFVHPDDVADLIARSARAWQDRGIGPSVRLSHADGTWVWVQATASPTLSHQGQPVTVFTVAGMPEHERAKVGLRSARARLRRLLDDVSGGAEHLASSNGSYDLTVEALAAALELRDDETGHHARRVADLALALTRAVDPELAREPELRYGYLLHDIGKIGIPDSILHNPNQLTARDTRTLQLHTTLGEHLISFIPFASDIAHDIVAYHHERWDGSGYPWGLAGEEIPLAARIFAVADAFDAITHARPYRTARSIPEAINEIRNGAGTHFDPAVVSAFLQLARR